MRTTHAPTMTKAIVAGYLAIVALAASIAKVDALLLSHVEQAVTQAVSGQQTK